MLELIRNLVKKKVKACVIDLAEKHKGFFMHNSEWRNAVTSAQLSGV